MKYRNVFLYAIITFLFSCSLQSSNPLPSLYAQFYFDKDNQGWLSSFAFYPPAEADSFKLSFSFGKFKSSMGDSVFAITQTGYSSNSRLFMYVKRQIEGLHPNTIYYITVSLGMFAQLIEPYNGDLTVGDQGAFVKVGAFTQEPINDTIPDSLNTGQSIVVPEFDVGSAANDSKDLHYIGRILPTQPDKLPVLLLGDNSVNKLTVSSDSGGKVWVLVGVLNNVPIYQRISFSTIIIQFQQASK